MHGRWATEFPQKEPNLQGFSTADARNFEWLIGTVYVGICRD
jgi:hypothetical protein